MADCSSLTAMEAELARILRRKLVPIPTTEKQDLGFTPADRFSDLPREIIHYIMSFLPTPDSTRMSTLSKKFFSIWISFPFLDFDQRQAFGKLITGKFGRVPEKDEHIIRKFLDYVSASISLRIRNQFQSVLTKFRINADLQKSASDQRVNRAVDFAIDNGVEELDLNFLHGGISLLLLPAMHPSCFHANFVSEMVNVLKLSGLVRVNVNDLMHACPNIRSLTLSDCKLNQEIDFPSAKLERLTMNNCVHDGLNRLKINAPNLHYFYFVNGADNGRDSENIDLLACQSLQDLSIMKSRISDEWVLDHISKLEQLEALTLGECNNLKCVTVENNQLVTFYLRDCYNLESVDVIAPALESFSYKGVRKPCKFNILPCQSLRTLSMANVDITNEWIEDHVSKLGQLEDFSLCRCNESLSKIRFSGKKLRRFELCGQSIHHYIEDVVTYLSPRWFAEPSLMKFIYKPCKIDDISVCKFLRNLLLRGVPIAEQRLEILVSELPDLQILQLEECNELVRFQLLHQKLRKFCLIDCNRLEELKIEAPDLCDYKYSGKVVSFGLSINCPRLQNPTLALKSNSETTDQWFVELRNLLVSFGHFGGLTLICNSDTDLIFPLALRDRMVPPLYDVKHLKIQIDSLTKIHADVVDSLLWLSHPESLCFGSASSEKVIKDFIFPKVLEVRMGRPRYVDLEDLKIQSDSLMKIDADLDDILLRLSHPESLCFASASSEKVIKFYYQESGNDTGSYESGSFCCGAQPIKCWRHYLKKVDFQNFEARDEKDRLLKYFCSNAEILEEISYNSKRFKPVQEQYFSRAVVR